MRAIYIAVALIFMCQAVYAFALGFAVAKLQVAAPETARLAGGELLNRLSMLGLVGGALLVAAVASGVAQLGARSFIRLLSPLFIGYGVWALIEGVPPLLIYAALEGEVSAAVAMTSSIGFVLVGAAGAVLSLIERKGDPSLPELS